MFGLAAFKTIDQVQPRLGKTYLGLCETLVVELLDLIRSITALFHDNLYFVCFYHVFLCSFILKLLKNQIMNNK